MNKDELKSRIEKIDNALNLYLKKEDNPQSIIYDAMRYSVFAGGKRLRPMLMLEWCKLCGGSEEDAMPFACAMEMIHTYSLIHDDLPAMDNDNLRRGMPTNHIKFGEANAILAGDALLNKAFETMLKFGKDAKNAMRAMYEIALSSGTEGMIGGQIVDIESEGKDISIDTLKYLHTLKTGAIIRSSCKAGAILAGAKDEAIKRADEFAINLGIAFQIRDDILDVEGSTDVLGKPVGSDNEQDKNTYVKLLGLDRSKVLVKEYSSNAKEILSGFGDGAKFLTELTDYLISRNN